MAKTYNDKDLQNFIRQTIGDTNANLRLGALSQEGSSNDIALYDEELSEGKVHKENVDKAVDFCYSDICVSIRRFSGMTDDEKDEVIKKGKSILGSVKQMILDILVSQNVEVVSGS